MCSAPKYTPPPPPPAAPPVLEQLAPKSATAGESRTRKKARGLSRYKIDTTGSTAETMTGLGSMPKKSGAGM
jgi:hypothetical protein